MGALGLSLLCGAGVAGLAFASQDAYDSLGPGPVEAPESESD